MNELIFFFHVLIVFVLGIIALRMGKEALIGWVALQGVLANLFVFKQIALFGFNVTCSDVFIIGSILGLNLLQEFHGKESSKLAIKISFTLLSFFGIMALFQISYSPSEHDSGDPHFRALLMPAPRLLIASLTVFYIVQQIDNRFFAFLKNRFTKTPLHIRAAVSLIVCQLIDTVLFTYAGLAGIVSSLTDVMILSMCIKCLIIICMTPLLTLSKRFYEPTI